MHSHCLTPLSYLLTISGKKRASSRLVTTAAMAKVRLVENTEEGGRERGREGSEEEEEDTMRRGEANGSVLAACNRRCRRQCRRQRKACVAMRCVRANVPGSFGRMLEEEVVFLPWCLHRSSLLSFFAPSPPSFLLIPLQSKNHTNRNQSFKAHRNGIKKPKNYVSKSLKGVSACLLACQFLVNFLLCLGVVCCMIVRVLRSMCVLGGLCFRPLLC